MAEQAKNYAVMLSWHTHPPTLVVVEVATPQYCSANTEAEALRLFRASIEMRIDQLRDKIAEYQRSIALNEEQLAWADAELAKREGT